MCIHRIVALEKASADLQAFQKTAQHSLIAQQSRGPLKRRRVITGQVGAQLEPGRQSIGVQYTQLEGGDHSLAHSTQWPQEEEGRERAGTLTRRQEEESQDLTRTRQLEGVSQNLVRTCQL